MTDQERLDAFLILFPEFGLTITKIINGQQVVVPNPDLLTLADYLMYEKLFQVQYCGVELTMPDTYACALDLWIAHYHKANISLAGGGAMTGIKQRWSEGDVSVDYWTGGTDMDDLATTKYGTRLMRVLKLFKMAGIIVSKGRFC